MRKIRLGLAALCASLSTLPALPAIALAPAARTPAPTVTTGSARNVGFAEAKLTGLLNPRGLATTYSFQYGTSRLYGQATPLLAAPALNRPLGVNATIGGLAALTVYHYRLVAENPRGVVGGADRSFKTGPIPLALGIAAEPPTVTFGNAVQVAGALTGSNSGGRDVVLQANAFPYTAGFANVGNPELTNPNGSFLFNVLGLTSTSQLRVVSVGTPTVVSPVVYAHVAVRVTVKGRHVRGRLRVSGFVTPAGVGAPVAIQKLATHRWVTVGGTVTRTGSRGRARYTKLLLGRRRHGLYRAYVRSTDGSREPGVSPPIRL